jgi:allophanate hydrolase
MEAPTTVRFGVPDRDALQFFGDPDTPKLFEKAVQTLQDLGASPVTIDFTPLAEAARLLYQGPWVAERMAALRSFFDGHAAEMFPVTRTIIEGAARYSAVDAFGAFYRLAELRRRTEPMWADFDVLLLPTAGTCFTLEQVAAEPIQRNTDLGYYTNFVNLLDLCATAVPAGLGPNGLPFGVTLMAPAGRDGLALGIADRLHRTQTLRMGATGLPVPSSHPVEGEVVFRGGGAAARASLE